MSIATRLQKATHALSPLQRVMLILQAHCEGREPDPELRRLSDPLQQKTFDRYMALAYVSNVALGSRCDAVLLVARDLEAMAGQLRLLVQAAGILEEDHGLKPPRRVRDWQLAGEMAVNEFLRSLAANLKEDLMQVLVFRWQEVRAIELLWDELATEFGGADPVDPQFRQKAAEAAEWMRALAAELNATKRLVEPDEAVIDEARKAVDDAFARLEPLL